MPARKLCSLPVAPKYGAGLATMVFFFSCCFTASASANRKPSAAPLRIKGSFVIAAICRDGIIVASDSRGTFKDSSGRRLAYYDVNQKIFPFGDNLVADTGYASLNDQHTSFLSALMASF